VRDILGIGEEGDGDCKYFLNRISKPVQKGQIKLMRVQNQLENIHKVDAGKQRAGDSLKSVHEVLFEPDVFTTCQ